MPSSASASNNAPARIPAAAMLLLLAAVFAAAVCAANAGAGRRARGPASAVACAAVCAANAGAGPAAGIAGAAGVSAPPSPRRPPARAVPVYTNVAGQTAAGPARLEGGSRVRFGKRSFPLEIFPPRERERILRDCGRPAAPAADPRRERRDAFYRNLLDRQDALEKAGATTPEKAAAQRALIRRAWLRRRAP